MIVKIDHVSFSCPYEYDYMKKIPDGYEAAFTEMGLKNQSCKLHFLQNWQEVHNIIFLVNKNLFPIEITQYELCSMHGTSVDFTGTEYCLHVKDINESKKLFECMGFVVDEESGREITLEIKPLLDKRAFKLKLKGEGSNEASFLDSLGFSSIGFFVDDAYREIKKIKDAGYIVTQIDELYVNGRWINVGFIRGHNGEIVEIIGLKRE